MLIGGTAFSVGWMVCQLAERGRLRIGVFLERLNELVQGPRGVDVSSSWKVSTNRAIFLPFMLKGVCIHGLVSGVPTHSVRESRARKYIM
jgi:hypothetical protein